MIFRNIIIFIILLAIWEAVIFWFHLPSFILPGPIIVFQALLVSGSLIAKNIGPTLVETLSGLLLGSLAGVWMAACLAYFRWARFWFLPLLITSQALPTFAIAPLLVIWFGYGLIAKIIVVMLMTFFPVVSAFYDGLRRTPSEWLYLAQVMGASPWRLLWKIQIPSALPALASGLRVAATFAPMGAIIGEWVGSSRGLGFLMINANARMQIDLMFAVLFVLIALTLALYFSIDNILKKLIFWSTE